MVVVIIYCKSRSNIFYRYKHANVLAHGTDIGRVIGLKTNELGERLSKLSSTLIEFRNCMLLTDIQGSFNGNDLITGAALTSGAIGHLAWFDADRQILKVKDQSQNFILGEKITSTSSGLATITRLDIVVSIRCSFCCRYRW